MKTDRILKSVMVLGMLFAALWAIAMMFGSALEVGVSIDEHYHVLDFRGWGWGADPDRGFGIFGLSPQIVFHLVNVIFGTETLGVVSFGDSAFGVRHMTTAVLGIITSVGVGATVSVMTRSRILGLWSAVALLTIQPFLGHAAFNPKDIPIACGFTLVTFSSVLFVSQLRDGILGRFRLFALCSATIFGLWIGAGTRLLFMIIFLSLVCLTIATFLILGRIRGWHFGLLMRQVAIWGAFVALGYLAVLVTNPCIVASPRKCNNPVEVFGSVLSNTSGFQWTAPTLMMGRLETPVDAAFWMLPVLLFVGLPIFILVLGFLGTIFAPENLKLGLFTFNVGSKWDKILLGAMVGVVLFQLLALPVVVIMLRQEIYDMQRHHLYTYAAVAILAGLGYSLVVNAEIVKPRFVPYYRWAAGVIGVLFLFIPLAEGLRLWPYNYVYVNPIASIRGIEGQWETDYWAVSLREALDFVPVDQPFSVVGPFWAVKPFMADRGSSPLTARANVGEVHVIEAYRPGLGWNGLPKECRDIVKIERNLRGHVVPIAQTGICPRSLGLGVSYLDVLAHDP